MIRFENDYLCGAHPRILSRLIETNDIQTPGYGADDFCKRAEDIIKNECNAPDADVHFLSGGTQTNLTIIASILRPHESVLAPSTGHIAVAETGAIEATGHKVQTIQTNNGKISADEIDLILSAPANVHAPKPGLIFISQSTELGDIYTLKEMKAISKVARTYDIPLFIDGARLGYALASSACDFTLKDIARLTDVFYIGGTKVGALFGEAVVITNDKLKRDFKYIMKQRGGLFAKGRILGLQFEELFTDGLYLEISNYAVKLAVKIKNVLESKNISLKHHSSTNQLFIEFTNEQFDELSKNYFMITISRNDTHTTARLVTSWSTKEEHVDALIRDILAL